MIVTNQLKIKLICEKKQVRYPQKQNCILCLKTILKLEHVIAKNMKDIYKTDSCIT